MRLSLPSPMSTATSSTATSGFPQCALTERMPVVVDPPVVARIDLSESAERAHVGALNLHC